MARQILLSSDTEFGGSLLPKESREWIETIDPRKGAIFGIQRVILRLRELGVSGGQISARSFNHHQVDSSEVAQALFDTVPHGSTEGAPESK
jgi:hypothetical protein